MKQRRSKGPFQAVFRDKNSGVKQEQPARPVPVPRPESTGEAQESGEQSLSIVKPGNTQNYETLLELS